MRFRTGAWRWLIVPTTHKRSDWRGEKRGASAPKRAEPSKRGDVSAMNSIPQHAVTKGYLKSDHLRAHASSASRRVVAKPDVPEAPPSIVTCFSSPIRELLSGRRRRA